jgi:hypothetical protein
MSIRCPTSPPKKLTGYASGGSRFCGEVGNFAKSRKRAHENPTILRFLSFVTVTVEVAPVANAQLFEHLEKFVDRVAVGDPDVTNGREGPKGVALVDFDADGKLDRRNEQSGRDDFSCLWAGRAGVRRGGALAHDVVDIAAVDFR